MANEKRGWFAPKRTGYGTGMPITWQGWLLTLMFVGGNIASAALLAPRYPLAMLAILAVSSLTMLLLLPSRTRGAGDTATAATVESGECVLSTCSHRPRCLTASFLGGSRDSSRTAGRSQSRNARSFTELRLCSG